VERNKRLGDHCARRLIAPRNLEATAGIRALLLSTPGVAGWEQLRTVRL